MARCGRRQSSAGYDHVIIRGINRQTIFLDEEDRKRFLSTMRRFSKETEVTIIVYCLMDNHVHLLIQHDKSDALGDFMKRLSGSYVFYYNQKYDRVGHLFQDRFKSEPIDTTAYLLIASRYIIQNPQKAGICNAADYRWSSWHEICEKPRLSDIQVLTDTVGGLPALKEYLLMPNEDTCLDLEEKKKLLSDNELTEWMHTAYGYHNLSETGSMTDVQKGELFRIMRQMGASVRQISRLTGISRNVIQKTMKATGKATGTGPVDPTHDC